MCHSSTLKAKYKECNYKWVGSSVHEILQVRILESVALPSSRVSSQPRDWTEVSCIADRLFTVRSTRKPLSGKELTCRCRRCKRGGLDPWVEKIPWKRAWQPTPVFLSGESRGQSLVSYSQSQQKIRHNWSDSACVHTCWVLSLILFSSHIGVSEILICEAITLRA